MPLPDCAEFVSDCEDLAVINQLDGFNLQPRLSIPFSGPIDVSTVTSDTVLLLSLGSTLSEEDDMPLGTIIGIDQIVWDPDTNTLHAESDALLAQHTRFALIVTRGIRDSNGFQIKASDEFRRFLTIDSDDYKLALVEAVKAAWYAGVTPGELVVASVFTTQSATAVLEKIRVEIHEATPQPADFLLGPGGVRTVFNLSEITGIAWRQQTRANPSGFPPPNPVPVNLSPVRNDFPGAVGVMAFGKFVSPDYEVHPGEYIPPVATRSGSPEAVGTNDIYFNLFLPSGPKPEHGWPVAIFGHGANQSKDTEPPLRTVGSLAAHGIAMIVITAVGHGFGSESTLTVSRTLGDPVTFWAGGRGVDQNGDHMIGSNEGISATPPRNLIFWSDGIRQTAVDLMQLVRIIEIGMDVDGDWQSDVDPSRIYYLGNSFGGGYGTVFLAIEPDVRAGVLAYPADIVPIGNLGPANRGVVGRLLNSRQPTLLNFPGIKFLNSPSDLPLAEVAAPYYHDNLPLRGQMPVKVQLEGSTGITDIVTSPVTNPVAGAMAIQEFLDRLEWVSQAGSPAAYAPHLRNAPLRGVNAKSVLYQIAKGDQTAPNPTATAIVRAGALADRTLFYRHDLAWVDHSPTFLPNLPRNPHGFNVNPNFGEIKTGAQEQSSRFFESNGTVTIRPEPQKYFEFPISDFEPLPEDLYFIP